MVALKRFYELKWVKSLGLFNLVVLLIVFPLFWLERSSAMCHFDPCCCGRDTLLTGIFLESSLYKLQVLFILALFLLPFDYIFNRHQLFQKTADTGFQNHMKWLLNPLPSLWIACATLAIDTHLYLYFFLGFCLFLVCRRPLSGVYVLFILVLLPSINLLAWACDCAKKSTLKNNMHVLQTLVETYHTVHGEYPQSLERLPANKETPIYSKDFANPWTGQTGLNKSYASWDTVFGTRPKADLPTFRDVHFDGFGFYFSTYLINPKPHLEIKDLTGLVIYEYINPQHYRVYGINFKQGRLLEEKGKILYLSNQ